MDRKLTGLDHVRLAVPDLARAADAWAELGFAVTPPRREAGGPPSCCVMFPTDHVELVEHAPPTLLALALGTRAVAQTAQAWRQAGLEGTSPAAVERHLDGDTGPVAFAEVAPPADALAGLPVRATAHLTPENVRRPEWLRHANGVLRIASLTVVVPSPEACAPALDKLVGGAALTWTDAILAARLGHAVLMLADADDVEALHGEAVETEPPPALVALGFGVADVARAGTALQVQGVKGVRRPGGSLGVGGDPRLGCLVEFRQAA